MIIYTERTTAAYPYNIIEHYYASIYSWVSINKMYGEDFYDYSFVKGVKRLR